MIPFFLLLELAALFVLSRFLTEKLYLFFLLISSSRPLSLSLLTAILFPGTVIHELSHLFTAEILGVHTGKMTLVPESLEDGDIRSGSVMIAQTDPFRRYAIGLAPVLAGLLVLSAISYWLPTLWQHVVQAANDDLLFSNPALFILLFTFYILFAVSNTMFSSKEDLKGFVAFVITLGILFTALYVAGFRVGLTGQAAMVVSQLFGSLSVTTGVVLGINICLLILLQLSTDLFGKLLHRKVVLKK